MTIEKLLPAYRVAAWVTGIGLVILVFVAMPLKYFFGQPLLVAIVGMAHGFLYMAYIVITLLLAERCRWRPVDALVILVARHDPAGLVLRRAPRTRRVREHRSPFADRA